MASAAALVLCLGLPGCGDIALSGLPGSALSVLGGGADVSQDAHAVTPISAPGQIVVPQTAALSAQMEDGTTSALIEGLLNRQSVLQGGALREVADAVMAANSRAAEADLRAATLLAEAKALNWLPSLGPSVSLTSLGSVVASPVIKQAILDNCARRAERDFARHDVEVAAVALAEDSTERVLQALELYLRAEAAQARADVTAEAMERMSHFAYIMSERVNAGISNRADLQVVT